MGRFLAGLFALLLPLGAAALTALWWFDDRFHAPGPLAEDTDIFVPAGTGVGGIASRLSAAGAIGDPRLFKIGVLIYGGERALKAGEYRLGAHASARAVMELLIEGRVLVRRVTVREGLLSAEVVAVIEATEALDGAVEEIPGDGALLPETYHFTRGDTRAGIMARMAQAMDGALAELWPGRAENLPFDTPDQALVLASIVEKETGLAAERPHIAGVFVNRLRKGMKLQSDPTVIYGLTVENGPLGRALRRADLDHDRLYNTYRIDGLPPAPIANPGRDAIAAVLNPLATKDLYFVADGGGGHAFAETLAAHNRNVAKWRKHQRAAREKEAAG